MRMRAQSRRSASVGREAVALRVARKVAERAFLEVEVVGVALEQPIQRERISIGPIRQQHHVLAVVRERLGLARLDDERAVKAASAPETPSASDTNTCRFAVPGSDR